MIVNKISKALLVFCGAIYFYSFGNAVEAKAPRSASQQSSPGANASEDAVIRSQIAALTKALENGNAYDLAALWTSDGNYIDSDGVESKGRAELLKRFSSLFKEHDKQLVELVPDNIRILANNVAYSEGTVQRKREDNAIPETRFSMVFVKQKGTWLISSASEIPIAAGPDRTSHQTLSDLSWLIGDWKAEHDGSSVRMKAEWAANKKFIHCKYEISKPNQPQCIDLQIISWDPRKDQVVSWNFDSTGGTGYGTWFREDQKWMVESTGVEHDGSTSRAINVIEPRDSNSFIWQTLNRSVDGIALGDTAPLKVERLVQ